MNTIKGKDKLKKFPILLDSGCSSKIVTGRIIKKLRPEKDAPMKRNTQDGEITTNLKVQIDFTLPALSAMNVLMWNFYVDDSNKGRYDMILERDL